MSGLELFDADFGVDGGGFELFVTEKLLDVADVGSAFEHVRGAVVADQVARAGAVDVGSVDELRDRTADYRRD